MKRTLFRFAFSSLYAGAVLLLGACCTTQSQSEPAHDYLKSIASGSTRTFDWSRTPGSSTTERLYVKWTGMGISTDFKWELFECEIGFVDGTNTSGREVTMSLTNLGVQGRKFDVHIVPDIDRANMPEYLHQKPSAPGGLDPIVPTAVSQEYPDIYLYKIAATGTSHWGIGGNPNPSREKGVDFLRFKGKSCSFFLLSARWMHLRKEPSGVAEILDIGKNEKLTRSLNLKSEKKGPVLPLYELLNGHILSNHDTTPPPTEGGGQDGDSSN